MKLYTKVGDLGETALSDGTRVWKDDVRVAAYGTVDELNAVLGWCRSVAGGVDLSSSLAQLQQELLVLGSQLARPAGAKAKDAAPFLQPKNISRLETWIDEATVQLPPLSHFIVPNGCELAARLHLARTVCRRAERAVVTLHRIDPTPPEAIVYLNRLSDLLFAWARLANQAEHCPDEPWLHSSS